MTTGAVYMHCFSTEKPAKPVKSIPLVTSTQANKLVERNMKISPQLVLYMSQVKSELTPDKSLAQAVATHSDWIMWVKKGVKL